MPRKLNKRENHLEIAKEEASAEAKLCVLVGFSCLCAPWILSNSRTSTQQRMEAFVRGNVPQIK
jgi:hypothetical protein